MTDIDLNFEAELWISSGKGAWHFVTLPLSIAEQVKFFGEQHSSYGTIYVKASIGQSEWKTSLFPAKKEQTFYLPVKAEIRKKESLTVGNSIDVTIYMSL